MSDVGVAWLVTGLIYYTILVFVVGYCVGGSER